MRANLPVSTWEDLTVDGRLVISEVLQAIDASSPLPIPPDRIRAAVSMGGILMSFPE